MSNYNESNNKTGYPLSGGMEAKPLHARENPTLLENPFGYGAIPHELGACQQKLLQTQAQVAAQQADLRTKESQIELLQAHNTQILEVLKGLTATKPQV